MINGQNEIPAAGTQQSQIKQSITSLESGYASQTDLKRPRTGSQLDSQHDRSGIEGFVEGEKTSDQQNVENHPEEKRGMDRHPHLLHAVSEHSPTLSPNLEDHGASRDSAVNLVSVS